MGLRRSTSGERTAASQVPPSTPTGGAVASSLSAVMLTPPSPLAFWGC